MTNGYIAYLKKKTESMLLLAFENKPYLRKPNRFWLCTLLLSIITVNFSFSQQSSSEDADSIRVGQHKSGYGDLNTIGSSKGVNSDLVTDDEYKSAWLDTDVSKQIFKGYYKFKRHLKEDYNLALGMDYMFLNQYASFSYTDRQAASGILRIFGTWVAFNIPNNIQLLELAPFVLTTNTYLVFLDKL